MKTMNYFAAIMVGWTAFQAQASTLPIGTESFTQLEVINSVGQPVYNPTDGTFSGDTCHSLQYTHSLDAAISLEDGDHLESITCTVIDGDNIEADVANFTLYWEYKGMILYSGPTGDETNSSQIGQWNVNGTGLGTNAVNGNYLSESNTFFPFDQTDFSWTGTPTAPVEITDGSNLWVRFMAEPHSQTGSCEPELQFSGCDVTYTAAPPVDLCANANCDENASCDPEDGSCSCNTGFSGDGSTCSDLDECANTNTNDCLETVEVCVNEPAGAGYLCICANGYEADDDNECVPAETQAPSSCPEGQLLTDTIFLSPSDYSSYQGGELVPTGVLSEEGRMGYTSVGLNNSASTSSVNYFYLPEGVWVTDQDCILYDHDNDTDHFLWLKLWVYYGGQKDTLINSTNECPSAGDCYQSDFGVFEENTLNMEPNPNRQYVGNLFYSQWANLSAENTVSPNVGFFGCHVFLDDEICQEIDDCADSPCQNNGRCIDGVNSYTCECPTMYEGNDCETPKPQMVELQIDVPAHEFIDHQPSDGVNYNVTWNSNVSAGNFNAAENTCPEYIDGLGDITATLNLPENSLISDMSCQSTLPQSNDYYLRFSLVESSQPYAVLHGDVAPSDFMSIPSLLPMSVNAGETHRILVEGYGDAYCAGETILQGCNLTITVENPCLNGGNPRYDNGALVCDCLENFGGSHCENTTTVYDIPAQDFAATTDFWGTYSDGLFVGDCNGTAAAASADFTDLLQENDRIETISCAYDMDGPSDPLPEDTLVLGISSFSHFYGNSVETLGQGWGQISEGQAWALRINLMPHDVDLDNNDSYVITARQRVMGDDTTCIEEHALEGCNVTVSGEPVHALELAEGWNIISTFINTQNRDFVDVVTPIREQLIIAKNYLGQAFMPEWGFNGIGNWQPGQGYQAKVSEAVTLNIHGPIIQPEHTPITLYEGWNMIAYLRMNPADFQEIMTPIQDQVVIAKNNDGNAYLTTYDFNGIGDMVPGQGYQVKVNENVDLVYNSNHDLYPSEGE